MVNSQLNFARTGAPALDAEFTSSYGPNDAEWLVLEEGPRSARPSGSPRHQGDRQLHHQRWPDPTAEGRDCSAFRCHHHH